MDDKLKRLREWIIYESDAEPQDGGGWTYDIGRARPCDVLDEIDRLLAEEPAHDDVAELRAENAVTDDREEILAALGLHPDTPTATVLAHLESVRAEARCSADARQLGRAEASARADALAAAAETVLKELVIIRGSSRPNLLVHIDSQVELDNALAAYRRGGAS